MSQPSATGATCCRSCASGASSCVPDTHLPTAKQAAALRGWLDTLGKAPPSGGLSAPRFRRAALDVVLGDPSPAPRGGLHVVHTQLAPGESGLEQTLPRMRELTAAAILDPRVRRASEFVVHDALPGDRIGEAHEIFRFLERRLEFRRDPTTTQFLQSPVTLIERIDRLGWAAGNCANHSMMAATLGHEVRLPLVWVLAGMAPGEFEHIYCAMRLDGLELNAPVGDVLNDLLSLDTGSPWNHAPAFGRHVNAVSFRVVPALVGF